MFCLLFCNRAWNGGAVSLETLSVGVFSNTTFDENLAVAVLADTVSSDLISTRSKSTTTNGNGGALFVMNSKSLLLMNSVLRNNRADSLGGALFIEIIAKYQISDCR